MKDSWVDLKIGEEINLLGGFPFNSSKFNEEGIGTPLIRIRDLLNSTQKTFFNGPFSNSYLMNYGDILVGMDGDYHIVKWKNTPSLLNQRILKISDKKNGKIDIDYLFYYLHPFLIDVHNKTAATTVKHLSSFDIIDAIDKFPPLPQQQKIANILSTCDEVIEKTEAAITKYQALKQGMMHDLFTRGIDLKTGQLRPTYQDAPELYKESELGMIPKDWEVSTIQEFASQNNYGIVDGPFGSNLKSIHYRVKGIPIIQSGFVTSNEFVANKYLFVDKEKYYSEIRSSVKAGDIIMAKIGAQCGTCALLPENHPDSIIAGNCLKITVDKNNNSNFLLNALHLYRKIGKLDLIVSTTAQPAISMSSLKVMYIPYPKLKEQNFISEKLNSVKNKIKTEQSALVKYQQLKMGLMQDLLMGKVEVTV